MSTMIEEIRKRIKAASDNTDEAGDYDEYGSGQSVGLATALQIIDEVVKQSLEADADSVAITKSMDYVDGIPDGGTREHPWNDHDVERGYQVGFRDGIGWERERLASCPTIKGWVARYGHGSLVFSNEKPSRVIWCGWNLWKVSRGTPAVVLPNSIFHALRWEDEPREVEIIIKEVGK